jgi:hypothetical protein
VCSQQSSNRLILNEVFHDSMISLGRKIFYELKQTKKTLFTIGETVRTCPCNNSASNKFEKKKLKSFLPMASIKQSDNICFSIFSSKKIYLYFYIKNFIQHLMIALNDFFLLRFVKGVEC